MWERLGSIVCSGILTLSLPGIAAAQAPPQAPLVAVCLVLSPKLPIDARVTGIVLSELQTIWTPVGVAVRLVGRPDAACQRIVTIKADDEARAEDVTHGVALGWVPFVLEQARQLVFLRVSRARVMVDGLGATQQSSGLKNLMLGKLLGRTLAHELGHVLLNSRDHSESGLMRARYLAGDLFRIPVSAYTLNMAERAQLFTAVTAQARVAKR